MFQRPVSPIAVSALILSSLILTGCQFGPDALKVSHAQYNDAIQHSMAEQLLLNLVRLKYRESPVFLEVGSISAQFVFDQSGNLSGTLNENIGAQRGNPDVLQIGGRVGYTERPTITFVPLSGDDFVQRLLSPISVETVVLLTHSGWRVDRVLRLIVQQMNGLDNAQSASGPTPAVAPEYRPFTRAAALLRSLQNNKQLHLEHETRSTPVSDALPITILTADAVVKAAIAGTRFRMAPSGKSYVLTRDAPALILRIDQDPNRSDAASQLIRLLRLAPDKATYGLVSAQSAPAGSRDPQHPRTNVALDMRSLMGVMFYLSQGIQVPPFHHQANLVTETLDKDGRPFDWSLVLSDVFNVYSQQKPPTDTAVMVRHRGYWFYIKDDDLSSKSTFTLLGQLFTLQAGSAGGAAPVLTLPVGG